MKGNLPKTVASVGSVFQFIPEMAPENAGTHCLNNCPAERSCAYSAKRLYIENPQRWANNIWHDSGVSQPTADEKIRLLSEADNPYSRCVYRCGLKIVDHQSILIAFSDGATGTFSMNGGAAASGRNIHITGTKGEIIGNFESQQFSVRLIKPEHPGGQLSRIVDVSADQLGNPHGNGDQAVVRDFFSLLRGEAASFCCTTLADSMVGHRLVFLAEESREKGGESVRY